MGAADRQTRGIRGSRARPSGRRDAQPDSADARDPSGSADRDSLLPVARLHLREPPRPERSTEILWPLPHLGTLGAAPFGYRLDSGALALSPNGQFQLLIQRDDNLVFETLGDQVIWQSHTAGHLDGGAVMQRDGNFTLYSAAGGVLFATGTSGYPDATLSVHSDGNLLISNGSGPVWCAGSTLSALAPGSVLKSGWALHAPAWMASLVMHQDGKPRALLSWRRGALADPDHEQPASCGADDRERRAPSGER